jgi:hypothetical protein
VHLRDDATGAAAGETQTPSGGKASGGSSSQPVAGAEAGEVSVGGSAGAAGKSPIGGSPDGGTDVGGSSAGEPAGGVGGEGGVGGAGGEGATGGETSACPPLHETTGGGELTLVQFAPLDAPRGRLVISNDGKSAYATTWGSFTQHFTRNTSTGELTAKSTAWVYNGEYAALSSDSKHLYVGGVNGLQFYDILVGADGSIANTNSTNGPSYGPAQDALLVGDTIFLASFSSLRTISGGIYDSTNRAVGTYGDLINLTRGGDYLYWTEYAVASRQPAGTIPKVGRARLNCDGTTGPREVFETGKGPFDVAVCDKTHYAYVTHQLQKADTQPGYIEVFDLKTCQEDFSTCKPVKTWTSTDIPGLVDPGGIHIAPDCSTLYLSNYAPTGGSILTIGLTKSTTPKLLQTFAQGKTYNGVTLTGDVNGWHMTWYDGYFYVPFEFGKGVAVFKSAH